jgi:hypothetical protein
MKSFVTESELLDAYEAARRLEVALLQTRIERLSAIIREHGLSLPSDDPLLGVSDGEHLEASRAVVIAAYDLLENAGTLTAALEELRGLVGSGMELVGGERWRTADRSQ